jgi:hypothetical protein
MAKARTSRLTSAGDLYCFSSRTRENVNLSYPRVVETIVEIIVEITESW